MAVVQTAEAPPMLGNTSLVNKGWTKNSSDALVKMVNVNKTAIKRGLVRGRAGLMSRVTVSLACCFGAGTAKNVALIWLSVFEIGLLLTLQRHSYPLGKLLCHLAMPIRN